MVIINVLKINRKYVSTLAIPLQSSPGENAHPVLISDDQEVQKKCAG